MSEFFAMGGYGAYVWPCVLLSFAMVAGLLLAARRRLRGVHQRIRQSQELPAERNWELRVSRAGESRA